MSEQRPANPAPRRIDDARLDALLNAFFDKELSAEDSGDLFKGLRANPAKAREFAATRRAVEDLRRPVAAPDLTNAILDAVHAKRPWLRDRDVWGVRIGRLGLVAALLLVLGGVLLQRRATPDAPVWNAGPAPLTEFVRISGEATLRTRESAEAAIASLNAPRAFAFASGDEPVVFQARSMPDLASGAAQYRVSFKPDAAWHARTIEVRVRSVDAERGGIVTLNLTDPAASPMESTVVTFRPR